MKKLIFLDCDGVISTLKSGWKLDPEKLELLGRLLKETGAKIVVSSSWRHSNVEETLRTTFKNFPFKDAIVGVTPRLRLPSSQGDWHFFMPERGLEVDIMMFKDNNVLIRLRLGDHTVVEYPVHCDVVDNEVLISEYANSKSNKCREE